MEKLTIFFGGGGSLGCEEPPRQRSTKTMYEKVHWNVSCYIRGSEQVLLSNQLGHAYACYKKSTIIIQRNVYVSYAKNLPAKLPGYGLAPP